jgi:hypothetical protein
MRDRDESYDDRVRRIKKEISKLESEINGEITSPEIEDDEGYLLPEHSFRQDEEHDIRATDKGWPRFLKAHPELSGFTTGPGVTVNGDTYPLRWHWHWQRNPPCADIVAAVGRAYRNSGNQPVTHHQVGVEIWGPDADAVSSGKFCGVLYHAAKRGEVLRYADTKPARFAPVE